VFNPARLGSPRTQGGLEADFWRLGIKFLPVRYTLFSITGQKGVALLRYHSDQRLFQVASRWYDDVFHDLRIEGCAANDVTIQKPGLGRDALIVTAYNRIPSKVTTNLKMIQDSAFHIKENAAKEDGRFPPDRAKGPAKVESSCCERRWHPGNIPGHARRSCRVSAFDGE
jgi:hypothetical protein